MCNANLQSTCHAMQCNSQKLCYSRIEECVRDVFVVDDGGNYRKLRWLRAPSHTPICESRMPLLSFCFPSRLGWLRLRWAGLVNNERVWRLLTMMNALTSSTSWRCLRKGRLESLYDMRINVVLKSRASQTIDFVSCPCLSAVGLLGAWWHGNAVLASLGGVVRGGVDR